MRRFFEIFRMEMRVLTRSFTLPLLAVAAVTWMIVSPSVLTGDGTLEGARELYVRYSLAGVMILLTVALVSAATGALARERAAKRLQLTLVRPVRYFTVAFGKMLAYVATAALVLALSLAVLFLRVDPMRPCRHVLSPVLPSPCAEAEEMYESYMKAPDTPDEVKKAKRDVVLRLLTQRAIDHYQTLPTNEVTAWKFDLGPYAGREANYDVRLRFSTAFDIRQDVRGTFRFADLAGSVSNITQAVLSVPLGTACAKKDAMLSFDNRGTAALMLRPRRDINLLVEGDAFWANAIRACIEALAILAVVVAFGVFLGAGLGRPVALFVALATLVVGEMSPSVVSQYPDQLETSRLDRIGLAMARAAMEIMHPISELSPMESLSKDECVEAGEAVRTLVIDGLAIPVFFALLSAFALPRKQDET